MLHLWLAEVFLWSGMRKANSWQYLYFPMSDKEWIGHNWMQGDRSNTMKRTYSPTQTWPPQEHYNRSLQTTWTSPYHKCLVCSLLQDCDKKQFVKWRPNKIRRNDSEKLVRKSTLTKEVWKYCIVGIHTTNPQTRRQTTWRNVFKIPDKAQSMTKTVRWGRLITCPK